MRRSRRSWNAWEPNGAKLDKTGVHSHKDVGHRQGAVPISLMKRQCAGTEMALRASCVEDLMFLGNGHYDIGYDPVRWLSDWIRHVGGNEIITARKEGTSQTHL